MSGFVLQYDIIFHMAVVLCNKTYLFTCVNDDMH